MQTEEIEQQEQKTALAIIVEKSNVDQESKNKLLEYFEEVSVIVEDWKAKAADVKVKDEYDWESIEIAKEGKKMMASVRIRINKLRKKLKDYYIKGGNNVDSVARQCQALVNPIEDYFESQINFAEKQKSDRIQKVISERASLLAPYMVNIHNLDLYGMSEEHFNNLLDKAKLDYEEKRLREEAEAELERQRLEKESKEALEKELELARLRKESEEAAILEEQKREVITEFNNMGFVYNIADEELYFANPEIPEPMIISLHEIFPVSDEALFFVRDRARKYCRDNSNAKSARLQKERDDANERVSRVKRMKDIGYYYNHTEGQFQFINKGTNENFFLHSGEYFLMTQEQFEESFIRNTDFINKQKEIEKTILDAELIKKKEAERLLQEQKDKEAEAERLKIAPDAEKWNAFFSKVKSMRVPDFDTEQYKQYAKVVEDKLYDLSEYMSYKINQR